MLKRFVTAVCCLFAFASVGAQAQVPQVLGLWELNLEASDLPERVFPQGLASERRSYFQRDDGYLVVLAIRVFGNGTPDFIHVVAKSDGKDYPQYQSGPLTDFVVDGATTPFTYSETIVSPNTAEVIAKRNGYVTNKGTRTISADGRTMTLNVAAVLQDGEEIPIVLVFDKQGE